MPSKIETVRACLGLLALDVASKVPAERLTFLPCLDQQMPGSTFVPTRVWQTSFRYDVCNSFENLDHSFLKQVEDQLSTSL